MLAPRVVYRTARAGLRVTRAQRRRLLLLLLGLLAGRGTCGPACRS
jgi:hypothetical protein